MPDEKPKPRKPKNRANVQRPMRPGPRGGALNTGPQEKPAPKEIPNAPQEGRPGHNGGGWLKNGNTVNVGRKPAEVRGAILQTVDEATDLMRSILDGEFKQEVRDMFGKVVGYRTASIQECAIVYKALAGHALPTRSELTGKDGGPVQVEGNSVERAKLLDRLDDSDLALAERLSEKAHADPDS